MLVTYIRSSSYNNYAYCQMQYFITYVLGHQAISGKKADLGTIVHKVMEALAGYKKHIQDNPSKKKLSILDDALGSISINKADFMKPKIVNDLLSQSYDFYSGQSQHNFAKADKDLCLDLVWNTLEYNDGQFDPRKEI